MLAYYVERHIRAAWSEFLFADPELEDATSNRNPVPSQSSLRPPTGRRPAHASRMVPLIDCFRTLIGHLESNGRNICRPRPLKGTFKAQPLESFELSTDFTEILQAGSCASSPQNMKMWEPSRQIVEDPNV